MGEPNVNYTEPYAWEASSKGKGVLTTPTGDGMLHNIETAQHLSQLFASPTLFGSDSEDDTEDEDGGQVTPLGSDTDTVLGAPSTSLNPERTDRPLERLEAGLLPLEDEVAQIPANTWRMYRKKLTTLCTSAEISTMDIAKRLRGISEIMYLGEEEASVECGEWGRLENAVRMCAVLAQVMGPEDEDKNKALEVMDQWTKAKLRDIGWVRHMLETGARLRMMQNPSQT